MLTKPHHQLFAVHRLEANTARPRPETPPAPESKPAKLRSERTAVASPLITTETLSTILISLAAIAVVLALLGYFVPGARKWAGVSLAFPGLLLCLYGYATAVYIAFTEDDFYGWLFLLFPFYAAYYVVSRWDEMRSRLIMVGVGLVLLTIGGQFLEADRARDAERQRRKLWRTPDQPAPGWAVAPRAGTSAVRSGPVHDAPGVDSQVVIERRKYVLEGNGAILGVTGRLVG